MWSRSIKATRQVIIVFIIIVIGLGIFQIKSRENQEIATPIYVADRSYEFGEEVNFSSLAKVSIKGAHPQWQIEEATGVLKRSLEKGAMITKEALFSRESPPLDKNKRLVKLMLKEELIGALDLEQESTVEVLHINPQQKVTLLDNIKVIKAHLLSSHQEGYYLILETSISQRDYIVAWRNQGHFEISQVHP